jgi:hypothetical protein
MGREPRWQREHDMSVATELPRLVPNWDRGPRQRFDIRPHGTEARARRHRRYGEKPCAACLAADNAAHAYRAARRAGGAYVLPEPSEEARHA